MTVPLIFFIHLFIYLFTNLFISSFIESLLMWAVVPPVLTQTPHQTIPAELESESVAGPRVNSASLVPWNRGY